MLKKTFLFITTILVATSASTGYGAYDALKDNANVGLFLDWFNAVEKHAYTKGLIVLDLIPLTFLLIQAFVFFKDSKNSKGFLAVLALIANLIGVFFIIQYAHPIASQVAGWTSDNVPSDWIVLKDEWLKYIGLSSLMGMLGWLFFVITYFVPATKQTGVKQLPRVLNFFKNALLFFLTFILGMGAARLYDFCFFPAQYEISGVTFIEMHRPVDLAMRTAGPILFAVISFFHVLLAILFFVGKSKQKGWLILAALFFLLCDTFIALQYNRPLNDLFLTWTPTTLPANWATLRDEWLSFHLYRNIFMLLGIVSILLTYFVQRDRTTTNAL